MHVEGKYYKRCLKGHSEYMYMCVVALYFSDPPVIATPDQPSVTNSGIEVMIGNNTCINNTFTGMVNFTCVVVSGAEPITFMWQVGGEAFMNNSHSMEIRFNNTVSILIVGVDTGASVDRDLNNYTCIASNDDGSDMAVSVLSRCGKTNNYKNYVYCV